MADIPRTILHQLNKGEIEALTLTEVLAVDFASLMKHSFPDIDNSRMREAKGTGWISRTRLAGELLYCGGGKKILKKTMRHTSDQVRGWGASLIAAMPGLEIEERLELIKPLADDPSPNTRETAWIMLRPHIAKDVEYSIKLLHPWTKSAAPNIRRYASEITRPRGVWCAHISELRENPEPGLLLLEPLSADPSRYVQNSVANWLNDASKDHPDFVKKTCAKWTRQSKTKETAYICKRAQRTINKA